MIVARPLPEQAPGRQEEAALEEHGAQVRERVGDRLLRPMKQGEAIGIHAKREGKELKTKERT